MNKELSAKIVVTPKMNDLDLACIKHTIDIVHDLQELEGVLLNEQTGEVIEIDELSRVVGILDGLLNAEEWTLN